MLALLVVSLFSFDRVSFFSLQSSCECLFVSAVANALPQMAGYGNVPAQNQYGQLPPQAMIQQPPAAMGPPQQQLGPNEAALAELINFD